MSFDARVYRVLIASPGDLHEERTIIENQVHAWNASHAVAEKAVLLPVRWETHSTPEYGDRPQAILNRRLVDECDLLIGAFWTRVGTPTGGYESGTVEEIEQIAKAGKPALLYFSLRQINPHELDLDQLRRVRELRPRIQSHALTADFATPADLGVLLSRHLIDIMRRMARSGEAPVAVAPDVAPGLPSDPLPAPAPAPAPAVAPETRMDEAALGRLYLEYWTQFAAAFQAAGIELRPPTPSSRNAVRFSLRSGDMRMNAFTSVRDRTIGVELVLSSPEADGAYSVLERQKDVIEQRIGGKLEWNTHRASHRIALTQAGNDPLNRAQWSAQHAWIIQHLDAFRICMVKVLEG